MRLQLSMQGTFRPCGLRSHTYMQTRCSGAAGVLERMPRRQLQGALAGAAHGMRVVAPVLGGVAVGVLLVLQLQEMRQRRKRRRSQRGSRVVRANSHPALRTPCLRERRCDRPRQAVFLSCCRAGVCAGCVCTAMCAALEPTGLPVSVSGWYLLQHYNTLYRARRHYHRRDVFSSASVLCGGSYGVLLDNTYAVQSVE